MVTVAFMWFSYPKHEGYLWHHLLLLLDRASHSLKSQPTQEVLTEPGSCWALHWGQATIKLAIISRVLLYNDMIPCHDIQLLGLKQSKR